MRVVDYELSGVPRADRHVRAQPDFIDAPP
jgi:hypothetical protein